MVKAKIYVRPNFENPKEQFVKETIIRNPPTLDFSRIGDPMKTDDGDFMLDFPTPYTNEVKLINFRQSWYDPLPLIGRKNKN